MKGKQILVAGMAAIALAAPLSVRKINDLFGTRVERVIDGDTFRTSNGQRIRLLGVNAPELELCLGEEAKQELVKLVEGKRVILREPFVDRYGRVVALVYYGNKLVNEEMLREGMGRYESEKNSQRDRLLKAHQASRGGKIGVFGDVCSQLDNKAKPKCNIKGNVDRVYGKKTYHTSGCREYERAVVELDLGDRWFCSEKEAVEAGFVKSLNCK